ncbi:membrane protein YczE [Nakamurella panacisegetis]|uniref:membrane protein YczE n=1 Tax=Nakamurella panacisegetis TaxID=1090615 RepID=UPI0018D335CB|nr:hypothetical protein [Nakamurella panacisegetis]
MSTEAVLPRTPRRRTPLAVLAPIPADRRIRRFGQLVIGLVLYGFTMGLMVRAVFGLDPWDVFHQGLTKLIGHWVHLSYGTVITGASVVVLLAWIPLRQRPGIGTVLNVLIIGWTTDATLAVIHPTGTLAVRILFLLAAVIGNAVAGALYIGAGLGPGPRDGLMTGMVARGIGSVRVVRTSIELSVLLVGWLGGGAVGLGTAVYALAIGPLLQLFLPRLRVPSPETGDGQVGRSSEGDRADNDNDGALPVEFLEGR